MSAPRGVADAYYFELAAAGLAPTVQVSKDGAAYGAAAGVVSEVGSGTYYLAATAADRAAEKLAFRASAAGYDDAVWFDEPAEVPQVVVDTTTTPWQLVAYRNGAALVAANELWRQEVREVDSTNVTTATQLVGRRTTP